MRKFAIMLVLLCVAVVSLIGCSARNYEVESLALETLATEGGWTITTHFLGWNSRPYVVRVKKNEHREEGEVVIQVCWSAIPVIKTNFQCDDEVIFPPRK